ncbi:MAG: hypothetical protein QXW02_01190 [Nitrososphaerota archaeon]
MEGVRLVNLTGDQLVGMVMVKRVFVDTAWNSKPHTCYDPAEDKFFEVEDLAELAEKYNEIYIDCALFPNMWGQLKALIDDGARVFYFAWPWKWKKLRERYADLLKKRFGKSKTDYGDAYILSRIYGVPKAFREITPLDVEFKPLLVKEKMLADELQRLRQRQELGVNVEDVISIIKEELEKARQEIVEKARERIPRFTDIAEELGLSDNDVNALSALVGLLIYLKWPHKVISMHKAIRYLGLYKPTKEDMKKFEERRGEKYKKRYNGCVRRYLIALTAAILKKERSAFPPKARDEKKVLRRLLSIPRGCNNGADAGGEAG